MEKDINDYVARRIQEIKNEIYGSEINLQRLEEMLCEDEESVEKGLQATRKDLEKMGWSKEDIDHYTLEISDFEENRLDDKRHKITKIREHIFALENDLIIYENFGR